MLQLVAETGLLKGKMIGSDGTTLVVNAALPIIVRRDSMENYQEFLTRLAKDSGITTAIREDVVRLERKRAKKSSNHDWTHSPDPDAHITKMNEAHRYSAHKAERSTSTPGQR